MIIRIITNGNGITTHISATSCADLCYKVRNTSPLGSCTGACAHVYVCKRIGLYTLQTYTYTFFYVVYNFIFVFYVRNDYPYKISNCLRQ